MNGRPALLGGEKAFSQPIAFTQPTIPDWSEVAPDLEAMYRSGWLTKGPHMRDFEKQIAQYLGVKRAVAVSSCTSGLILALQGLDLDRKKGEIIVPSFSFMATFHSLWWNGLKPVFVDCEPDTFTMNPQAVEEAINENTVGIMAACVFGNPPDWPQLLEIAQQHKLPIFSDSAHGLGPLYRGGTLGGYGRFEVFSLSPTKLLAAGEGGVVTTNDDALADYVTAGRDYGNPGSYDCPNIGLNARMSDFHAILASAGLKHLSDYAAHRSQVVEAYKRGLSDLPLGFQKIRQEARSSYKDFAVVVKPEFSITRDKLSQALNAEGIPNRAYFYPAGHQLSCYAPAELPWYRQASWKEDCRIPELPVTEVVSEQVLCLPISSHMPESQVEVICQAIHRIHKYADELK